MISSVPPASVPAAGAARPEVEPVVYVVDDDDGVRESLRWLVESSGRSTQTFRNAQEFLNNYLEDRPGCLILDIRMPVMGGFELQDELNRLSSVLPVIFITGHGDVPMSVRAMKNGAIDFIQKPYNYQQMLDTIQASLKIGIAAYQRKCRRQDCAARLAQLSPREHMVLDEVVQGKSSKQIALDLGISAKTVEVHRTKIRDKLHTDSVAQLIKIVRVAAGHDD